jgi:hypothetical protein
MLKLPTVRGKLQVLSARGGPLKDCVRPMTKPPKHFSAFTAISSTKMLR